ncbi:GAF domain-containing protein [Mycobacterium sp. E136]|uniref:GAF domain-containing protein n=1 Tax=Mycobacterium sp. E136 TaxID=1834125 RepID=UPI001E60D452|nr:GAF domain-containing protein [Mycobacterium sp. E136]
MTERVRRFDDYLNRLLEELAREAGENVETYVARAVATQMANDMRRASDPAVGDLQAHLSTSGVLEKTAMPDVTTVIADPDRLRALHETGLLDSPPEAIYDRITRAAADALDAPYATLTLVDQDRQFFKSAVGLDTSTAESRHTPLKRSVCQYAVADGAPLILEDARLDPTFKQHPAVRDGSVVAYLGIPLMDQAGNAVGTLCVYDTKPRLWGTGHLQVLSDLAALAAERIFTTRTDAQQ